MFLSHKSLPTYCRILLIIKRHVEEISRSRENLSVKLAPITKENLSKKVGSVFKMVKTP
jgi:hypothetical protein